MNIILKSLHAIHWFIVRFINSLIACRYQKKILVNALVDIKWGKLKPTNWGDDLNVWLLKQVSGKKIVVRNATLFWKNGINYVCIGSIIGNYENGQAIICGTGAISSDVKIKQKPLKVLSVRGALTRNLLLKQGIDVPPVYGDLALLTSRYYSPLKNERKRLCIIPHYIDFNNRIIHDYYNMHSNDTIVVDLAHYSRWTDVIDAICSCDYVLSSSLHGLIISDSYNIPNLWVSFSDKIKGDRFKYLDYFSSVDRNQETPMCIAQIGDVDEAIKCINSYKRAEINFDIFSQIICELRK